MKSKEAFVRNILLFCASISVATVFGITLTILMSGWPVFTEYGFFKFLLGTEWKPVADEIKLGILPMIAGTGAVTLCALLIGAPIGILSSVYIVEVANKKFARISHIIIDLLAGIPSVVYGFWGIVVLVPFLRLLGSQQGYSVLAGGIILAIMILPTIVRILCDAFAAVPKAYRDGSYALGAGRWHTIFKVVVPAAAPGIITAIVLGFGRAVGETMAVLMVTGNSKVFPTSIMSSVRTLTGNIALEISYSFGLHRQALFASGAVLMFVILIINILIQVIIKRIVGDRYA